MLFTTLYHVKLIIVCGTFYEGTSLYLLTSHTRQSIAFDLAVRVGREPADIGVLHQVTGRTAYEILVETRVAAIRDI